MSAEAEKAVLDDDDVIQGAGGKSTTVAELRQRVTLAEDGVVRLREVSYGSRATLEVLLDETRRLAEPFDDFVMIIDLKEAGGVPGREYRWEIPSMFETLPAKHIAIAFYGNPMLRVASKFVVGRMAHNVSIHRDYESALDAARAALSA